MSDSVSFRLPPDLRKAFERFCRAQRRPASEVLREAVRRYMHVEELRRLRSRLRPYAEVQGIVSDEEFFRRFS